MKAWQVKKIKVGPKLADKNVKTAGNRGKNKKNKNKMLKAI